MAVLGAAAGLALGLAILAGAPVVDGVGPRRVDATPRADRRVATGPDDRSSATVPAPLPVTPARTPSPAWAPVPVTAVIAPAADALATSRRDADEASP